MSLQVDCKCIGGCAEIDSDVGRVDLASRRCPRPSMFPQGDPMDNPDQEGVQTTCFVPKEKGAATLSAF